MFPSYAAPRSRRNRQTERDAPAPDAANRAPTNETSPTISTLPSADVDARRMKPSARAMVICTTKVMMTATPAAAANQSQRCDAGAKTSTAIASTRAMLHGRTSPWLRAIRPTMPRRSCGALPALCTMPVLPLMRRPIGPAIHCAGCRPRTRIRWKLTRGIRVAHLLSLSPAPESDAPLPALELLSHQVTALAATPAVLVSAPTADVIIVDARRDLAQAKSLCKILRTAGHVAPILLVATEGGLAAISPDWGVDDLVLAGAGPAEIDARIRLLTARSVAEQETSR